MNILFAFSNADILGGGEISFCQLIKCLDQTAFQRFVACPARGEVYSEIERLGLTPRAVAMPRLRGAGLLHSPQSLWGFVRLIARLRIDLVHANGTRAMLYCGIAARLAGAPVVWHVRVRDRDPLLDQVLAPIATRIIVNSRYVAGRFSFLRGTSRKLRVVYNGVDTEQFDAGIGGGRIREEFHIADGEKVVTIIGRFDEWKGHRFFLEAAARVAEKSGPVRFLVVGEGKRRKRLASLAATLGIADRVVFCGYRRDVPEILAASDCLVSASLAEHFGRVIIEAMATAKPVIATEAGGAPEIVVDGETGLLVKPADPEALASALTSLLQDPVRSKRMGLLGCRRAAELFTAEMHARNVEKIYREILQPPVDRKLAPFGCMAV